MRIMNKYFYHPSTDKMYDLIKSGEPITTHYSRNDVLEKVSNTCDVCQRISKEPHLLRVSLPADQCVLNLLVAMDIMTLDS